MEHSHPYHSTFRVRCCKWIKTISSQWVQILKDLLLSQKKDTKFLIKMLIKMGNVFLKFLKVLMQAFYIDYPKQVLDHWPLMAMHVITYLNHKPMLAEIGTTSKVRAQKLLKARTLFKVPFLKAVIQAKSKIHCWLKVQTPQTE